jgi:hypothetical protein
MNETVSADSDNMPASGDGLFHSLISSFDTFGQHMIHAAAQ